MYRSLRTVRHYLSAGLAGLLVFAMVPGVTGSSASAAPGDETFRPLPDFKLGSGSEVRIRPSSFTAFEIDRAELRGTLRAAPRAALGRASQEVSIPTPSGVSERFAVQRTETMESELAARHPDITTYSGRSLDRPGTTVAMDLTPMGFHASVRDGGSGAAWYVDPAYNRRGTTTHLSYYGGSLSERVQEFVEREAPAVREAIRNGRLSTNGKPGGPVTQRIYRLALTSDPSYAAYFGTENVLAEKVTLINRVNQIYNDDLAVQMQLVNATDALNLDTEAKATGPDGPCGEHPCFDPATGPDTFSQLDFCDVPGLGRNRTVLGQLVGAGNYDVGHLALGVNGGGIAYLGVVGTDYKGSGCTGLPEPVGDFFAIDYVAHELGHQFAGNHTFNGRIGACAGGNRNQSTSVEPGSGSSVMAYAGICASDDLQPHTDPYFSQRTLREFGAYIAAPLQPVVEVQTVSLRNFAADGDSFRLGFETEPTITLTRGVDYDAAGVEAAVETLTGLDVTIAQWGYDPYNSETFDFADVEPIDDTGFQVIFAPTVDPFVEGDFTDVASLVVTNPSSGVDGFVGETAAGGEPQNDGYRREDALNTNPVVRARGDKTLPIRTPFVLRGAGRDADGDTLTYLWEQNDIGIDEPRGTALVNNTKVYGPLFRVFGSKASVGPVATLQSPSPGLNLATGSPARTFPDLTQVLAGNTNARTGRCPRTSPQVEEVGPKRLECYSEFLPTSDYRGRPATKKPAMNFRLTARDGHPNGGGVAYDDVRLRLDRSAGPFLVTSQSRSVKVRGGSRQVITWKVNGTRKLANSVKIRLSVNGGKTFGRLLRAKTQNDGRVVVRIPRVSTNKARIMIKARGNYFFAVNDSEFRIRR